MDNEKQEVGRYQVAITTIKATDEESPVVGSGTFIVEVIFDTKTGKVVSSSYSPLRAYAHHPYK